MLERTHNPIVMIGREFEAPGNLEAERERQVTKYLIRGFNEELRMNWSQYSASFPNFSKQQEEYKGRFNVPLLIDPRIPLNRQCERSGIISHINTYRITNQTLVPNKPYAIWTHDANPHRLESDAGYEGEKDIHLGDDEVRSPLIEVIALFIQHPEYFEEHGADAFGSIYTDRHNPFLDIIRGWPRIYSRNRQVDIIERWGILTRGKEISMSSP